MHYKHIKKNHLLDRSIKFTPFAFNLHTKKYMHGNDRLKHLIFWNGGSNFLVGYVKTSESIMLYLMNLAYK
jgi:hypothetical protein